MKQQRIILALTVLILASLACQAITGGGDEVPAPPINENTNEPLADDQPTEDPGEGEDSGATVSSDFPMTADAYGLVEVGDGSILYYTKLSLDDVMKFYQDEYTSRGYTERELLTVVSAGTFSIVFDGDPSGKAVVIQSVDLGDGSRTVAIRLEDV